MGSRDMGEAAPRWSERPVRAGLVLVVLLFVFSLAVPAAAAFSLPGRRPAPAAEPTLSSGPSRLQEVAPPLAVQQLQEALDGRRPQLEILSPADGALLPEGPWTLRLQVEDWPLVDAGPLGLGPHLVVQLDGDPPLPLVSTSATMRPLEPGSHRLTVYAARPWGEAVKSPGAQRQIRLQRATANPHSLPAPGSPQLIAVSPRGRQASTPLLLDWLLLDAPLQNLRSGDASWRLRVSVDGDTFLVDQQTPLWLEGWRPGSNAILLELLDGLGEPLQPPFNSLAGEVILEPDGPSPRWQGGRLEPAELASLLGEAPPPTPSEPALEANRSAVLGSGPGLETASEPAPESDLEAAPGSGSEPGLDALPQAGIEAGLDADLRPSLDPDAGTGTVSGPEPAVEQDHEQAELPPSQEVFLSSQAEGPEEQASLPGRTTSAEEPTPVSPAPEKAGLPDAAASPGGDLAS